MAGKKIDEVVEAEILGMLRLVDATANEVRQVTDALDRKMLTIDPHAFWLVCRGTREGARAAWGFIADGFVREFGPAYPGTRGYVIVETYRRELEAMNELPK